MRNEDRTLAAGVAVSLSLHVLLLLGAMPPAATHRPTAARTLPRVPLEAVVTGRRLPKDQLQCREEPGPALNPQQPEAHVEAHLGARPGS